VSQTDTTTTESSETAATQGPDEAWAGKGRAVAVAAGAGAAVAGIAGGLAVAARDTRRRVLGVPVGRRSGVQQTASQVVDRIQEPVRRVGSRFTRE
jgi:hypothetical protein